MYLQIMVSFACVYYAVCTLWQLACHLHSFSDSPIMLQVHKIHSLLLVHNTPSVNTDIWVLSKTCISMSSAARLSLEFSQMETQNHRI